jgi:tetrahydromethanopterin S-methyltransferase subunit G
MGVAGKDGLNGLNGIDGLNGTNGIAGLKGDKGDTGANGKDVDPALVTALQDTDTTIQNNAIIETTQRTNADTKLQNNINSVNSRVDDVSNRVSKLEKTQVNLRTEIKFIREKHLEVGVYSVYSTTRNTCAEVGLNVVIPIGESYQDRENKRVNARLDRLERKLGATTIIERTLDKKGRVTSISIGNGQLSINGGF